MSQTRIAHPWYFIPENSRVTDLGCSTGKFIFELSRKHKSKKSKYTVMMIFRNGKNCEKMY